MYLGTKLIDQVEQLDGFIRITFTDNSKPEELKDDAALQALQTPEAIKNEQYFFNKRLYNAGEIYRALVSLRLISGEEAVAVLQRASNEIQQRLLRAVNVITFGLEDEHEAPTLPQIEEAFKLSLKKDPPKPDSNTNT